MLAQFFNVILTAIAWLGRTAFTGASGAAVGVALAQGFTVLLARIGVSLITFGIIYTATTAMTSFVVSQLSASPALDLMEATGVTTGINILLSTIQSIVAIRVTKVALSKANAL